MADSLLKTIDGWFSHESHSLASYYYATIKDNNNATAMGLSTMVISQKAPVVEHIVDQAMLVNWFPLCFSSSIFNWCDTGSNFSSTQ